MKTTRCVISVWKYVGETNCMPILIAFPIIPKRVNWNLLDDFSKHIT
jgi:hypothetical protein